MDVTPPFYFYNTVQSFFSPFFNVTLARLRRPANDCSLKDWETPFSQSQCVSPVIACGQSRGDTRAEWLPLKQNDLLRWWLVSHRVLIFREAFRLPAATAKFHTLYHYPLGNKMPRTRFVQFSL